MMRPGVRLPSGVAWTHRRKLAIRTTRGKLAGLAIGAALLAACQPSPGAIPSIKLGMDRSPVQFTAAPNVPGDPNNGRKLFTDTKFYPPNGCGSCHTLLDVSTGTYP